MLKKFYYSEYYRLFLLIIFFAMFLWAANDPKYFNVWLTENLMVFIGFPLIVFLGKYFKISNLSYTLITIFLCLTLIGSHYSYAETPFGYVLQNWLNSDRNMYDRLVHFSFGLLFAYPIREIFFRLANARGFWSYYIPFDIVVSLSAMFELIEWIAVMVSGYVAKADYLGMQGDIFDAQKDILMAALGAISTLFIIGFLNWIFSKQFRTEMKQSLRIQDSFIRPEGEVEIAKMAVEKARAQGKKIKEKRLALREKRKRSKQLKKREIEK